MVDALNEPFLDAISDEDVSVIPLPQSVNNGHVPGDGGRSLLSRLVGESKAKGYLRIGREIEAWGAEELGLVVHVPDDGSMDEALDLAKETWNNLRRRHATPRS